MMTGKTGKTCFGSLVSSCLILFDLGSCTGASSEPLQAITDGPRDAAAELALPGAPAQPALGDVGDRVDPW